MLLVFLWMKITSPNLDWWLKNLLLFLVCFVVLQEEVGEIAFGMKAI
jgi:hypothetical protein